MTDQELLAYEREHHDDPHMTLAKAKEMQRVALQFWHLGAANKKADPETEERRGVGCIRSCFRPTPLSLSQKGAADEIRTRSPRSGCRTWHETAF